MARMKRTSTNADDSPSPPKMPRTNMAQADSMHSRFNIPVRTTPELGNGMNNMNLPGAFQSSPPDIHLDSDYYSSPGQQQHDAPSTNVSDEHPTQHTNAESNGDVPIQESTPTPNGTGVEILGREVKKVIAAANKLRDLGIEKFDLKLPKICVVGDQSTGKSSLIEGISAIKVPRGEDTCTRCPLELILQESAFPWTCKLTVVRKYRYAGGAVNLDVSRLGPWFIIDVPELFHFAKITDKSLLPFWLRRAQLAILNPQEDPEKFRGRNTPQDVAQVPFSPNFIRLEISGPGTPNLSFYDLPGVIVQDKQFYVPQLIERLVSEYVSAPNCLVLYTLPMNNDVANSNAGAIVKKLQATNRTLGVITKPDTLVPSNVTQWKRILDGVAFPLGFGYFVVKNEPDESIQHQVARQREARFFERNPMFSQDLAMFNDRFGTSKLQDFLSRNLTIQITEQLPSIRSKIDDRAKLIEEELLSLPKPPPDNMVFLVQAKAYEFGRYLTTQMEAGSSKDDFFNVWRAKAEETRNALVQSFPDVQMSFKSASTAFAPRTPSKKNRTSVLLQAQLKQEDIAVISDDDEPTSSQEPASPAQAASPKQPSGSTVREKTVKEELAQKNRDAAKIFSLSDIKARIAAATRGFPGAFDPKVIEQMYGESTMHWQHVFSELTDFTKVVVENLVNQAHGSAFREFNNTSLFDKVEGIMQSSVLDALKRHQDTLDSLLTLELGRPLTINDADFVTRKETLDKEIVERRRQAWVQKRLREILNERGKLSLEDKKVAETDTDLRISSNPYKLEISAMASTRAYYECVAKRFSDICHTLTVKRLFAELCHDVPEAICSKLELTKDGANDRLRHMAEISPEVAHKRTQCAKDLDALKNAKAYLEDLLTHGTTNEEQRGGVPSPGTVMPDKMEE